MYVGSIVFVGVIVASKVGEELTDTGVLRGVDVEEGSGAVAVEPWVGEVGLEQFVNRRSRTSTPTYLILYFMFSILNFHL